MPPTARFVPIFYPSLGPPPWGASRPLALPSAPCPPLCHHLGSHSCRSTSECLCPRPAAIQARVPKGLVLPECRADRKEKLAAAVVSTAAAVMASPLAAHVRPAAPAAAAPFPS